LTHSAIHSFAVAGTILIGLIGAVMLYVPLSLFTDVDSPYPVDAIYVFLGGSLVLIALSAIFLIDFVRGR